MTMPADQVRAARIQLGMTQQQLADALGLVGPHAKDVVRSWEAGRRPISGPPAMLLRYLLHFGVMPEQQP